MRLYKMVTTNKVSGGFTTDEQFEDENIDEMFVYSVDGETYRYVMVAGTLPVYKSNTFVILENIKTLRTYILPWNEFFGSTGSNNARKPKFKKI